MAQPTFLAAGSYAQAFQTSVAVQLDFGSSGAVGLVVQGLFLDSTSSDSITGITVGGTLSGGTTTGSGAGATNYGGTITGGAALTLETAQAGMSTFLGTTQGGMRAARAVSALTGLQWVQLTVGAGTSKPALVCVAYSGVTAIGAGATYNTTGAVSQGVTTTANDVAAALFFSSADDTYTSTPTSPTTQRVRGSSAGYGYCSFGWDKAGSAGTTTIAGSITGAFTVAFTGTKWALTGSAAAPVLSSPTGSATGPTQATIGLTTDTAPTTTAVSYQILPAATAQPSAPTIVGTPDGTISTGSVGALTKAITALATNTALKAHFAQGTTSNVVSTLAITPSTLASSGSPAAQTGTTGGSFTWTGATPNSLLTNTGNGSGAWSIVSSAGFTVAPSINTATGQLSGGTLDVAGSYSPQVRYTDSSTVPSAQTLTFTLGLTVSGGGDTTSPTMSAASVTGGTLSAIGSITSSETGTLWWKMDGSATATDPGAGNEAGAGWSSQSMLAAANAVNFGTQPAGTRYGHYIGVDAAGNRAAVVNASGTVSGATLATSVSITLTTDGTTPAANLTGLKVAVFDQATPDLWAGHAPIYATSAGTTNGAGVLTCSIAGLTSLAPGALAGLVVSNSDGTLGQGAAQKGYVGPALVS